MANIIATMIVAQLHNQSAAKKIIAVLGAYLARVLIEQAAAKKELDAHAALNAHHAVQNVAAYAQERAAQKDCAAHAFAAADQNQPAAHL